MAFGFPASYTATIDLNESRQNARETVRSIFELLGWKYTEHHADHFTAKVPVSGASWGETLTVTLEPPRILKVHSACSFLQIFDWGKNKRNVEAFVDRFSARERRTARAGEAPEFIDSTGKTPLDRALADGATFSFDEGELINRQMEPEERLEGK